MSRPFAFPLLVVLALALTSVASAEVRPRQDIAPDRGARLALRMPFQGRRVPPRPTGPPPLREVRNELRQMTPQIQACANQYPPPGTGRTRRLRVRVWLLPQGTWTLEIPEIDENRGPNSPNHAALRSCIASNVTMRISRHMRRFRGATRQKVERAFRVTTPAEPPSGDELARRVTRRRTQLLRCIPGAGSVGEEARFTVQGTLQRDGTIQITGLGVPAGVPLDTAATCVGAAIAPIQREAVTREQAFEATFTFHYRPPAAPPQPDVPPIL